MASLVNHFYVTLFSSSLLKIYKENKIAAFTVKLTQPIILGSNDNWEVGVCEISCSPPLSIGTGKAVTVVGDTNVLLYCNLVSPQFVSDQTARVLRTFIHPSSHCEHKFTEVYYVPVEQRNFQDIRIEFLTLYGNRVKFKDSATPSKVVLHFRKNNRW